MPATVKMAREFGDDLAIVMVESQGTGAKKSEAFAWNRKWMGTQVIWANEAPFNTGSRGIPNFALLSNTGEILLMGNPISMHNKIEELVTEQIALAKEAPEDAPKSLKKAYKAFGKGDLAKAIAEARKVEAKADEDAEAAKAVVADFLAHTGAKFDRIDWLLENGYLMRAQDQLKSLSKATKGLADFEERTAALDSKIDSDELKDEFAAAKAFAKLEEKVLDKGLDDKIVKKLQKFADKNADTSAGKRAQHLVDMAAIK